MKGWMEVEEKPEVIEVVKLIQINGSRVVKINTGNTSKPVNNPKRGWSCP